MVRKVKKRKKLSHPPSKKHHTVIKHLEMLFTMNKHWTIAVVTLFALALLSIFLLVSPGAGKAFYVPDVEYTAGIIEPDTINPDEPFTLTVAANIGLSKTVAMQFHLRLPDTIICDDLVTDTLLSASETATRKKAECSEGAIYFEYAHLDYDNAFTGKFNLVEITFDEGLPKGTYPLFFESFDIYDVDDPNQEDLIMPVRDPIIIVGDIPACAADEECEGDCCYDGVCAACEPECLISSECSETQGCVEGECVEATPCSVDTECEEPTPCCNNLIGTGFCSDCNTNECSTNEDCPENYECSEGTCQEIVCTEDADCTEEGFSCHIPSGRCITGPCEGGPTDEICNNRQDEDCDDLIDCGDTENCGDICHNGEDGECILVTDQLPYTVNGDGDINAGMLMVAEFKPTCEDGTPLLYAYTILETAPGEIIGFKKEIIPPMINDDAYYSFINYNLPISYTQNLNQQERSELLSNLALNKTIIIYDKDLHEDYLVNGNLKAIYDNVLWQRIFTFEDEE
jgi:hypothetical protein